MTIQTESSLLRGSLSALPVPRGRPAKKRLARSAEVDAPPLGDRHHPLESLERDHRSMRGLGRRVRDHLLSVERPRDGVPGRLKALARALRNQVEWRHADKLEHVLMPWLVQRGFDWNGPVVRRIFELSCLIRQAIETLANAAEREPSWSDEELRRVRLHAGDLVELLDELSATLSSELFPEVQSRLCPRGSDELGRRLQRCDEQFEAEVGPEPAATLA